MVSRVGDIKSEGPGLEGKRKARVMMIDAEGKRQSFWTDARGGVSSSSFFYSREKAMLRSKLVIIMYTIMNE